MTPLQEPHQSHSIEVSPSRQVCHAVLQWRSAMTPPLTPHANQGRRPAIEHNRYCLSLPRCGGRCTPYALRPAPTSFRVIRVGHPSRHRAKSHRRGVHRVVFPDAQTRAVILIRESRRVVCSKTCRDSFCATRVHMRAQLVAKEHQITPMIQLSYHSCIRKTEKTQGIFLCFHKLFSRSAMRFVVCTRATQS